MNKRFLCFFILVCFIPLLYLAGQHPPGSLTYQNSDGNRYVAGKGNLSESNFLDIRLKGIPQWVVSASYEGGFVIVATLDDGSLQAFQVRRGNYREITTDFDREASSFAPPVLSDRFGRLSIVDNPGSRNNHPIILGDGRSVYIDSAKGLIAGSDVLNIKPLPDGRILRDEKDRLLVLSDPTSRYGHGVLGDRIEAGSITLVETAPRLSVISKIDIEGEAVVEGIMPIWADMNGDGIREILVTVADRVSGARLVLFDEAGNTLARGPAVGLGFRWRNQLAIAPFGPEGQMEIVDTHTPHIGGPVEFFQWRGSRLIPVASVRGFTSHVMGSRNLDMALAGDFDGNGIVEIVVPTYDRRELGAIERLDGGAHVLYRLGLGSPLKSNLSALVSPEGEIGLAAGLENGMVRIWLP